MDASNDWIREHGLLLIIIGVLYLIVRDVLGTLLRRFGKEQNGNGSTLLSQKADYAITLATKNNEKLSELRDDIAKLVRRSE